MKLVVKLILIVFMLKLEYLETSKSIGSSIVIPLTNEIYGRLIFSIDSFEIRLESSLKLLNFK